MEQLANRMPARALLPPVEHFAERASGRGQHTEIEQVAIADVGIDTDSLSIDESVAAVLDYIDRNFRKTK